MSETANPRALSDKEASRLAIVSAGIVDVRRDVYQLVRYVQSKGLVRTVRGNQIPKTAARQLAKVLSYTGESAALEEDRFGYWSNDVSHIARKLGIVAFDTEGVYAGYSSTEPSFPDNEIEVQKKAWRDYLKTSPLAKEKAILDVLLNTAENEFFQRATLVDGERFDMRGCATGPAGKMKLHAVRRGLLKFLASLQPDVWYECRDVVEVLQDRLPHLILDPGNREPDAESHQRLRKWEYGGYGRRDKKSGKKPSTTLEDIYTNFREYPPGSSRYSGKERQITSKSSDAFHLVEGRYLEFFLCEIPYICGFVDLAFRKPRDRHGLNVSPPLERLRAFRLTNRFFQIMQADTDFNDVKVTVLPTFEVLVEASSYPDVALDTLAPFTTLVREDGPIHRLRLEKKKVVAVAAQEVKTPPACQVLEKLSGSPLPENVVVEVASWSERGEKVTIYDGFGLLEINAGKGIETRADGALGREQLLQEIHDLVEDKGLKDFAVVRNPKRIFERLEEKHHVPIRVKHGDEALVSCTGQLGHAAKAAKRPTATKRVLRQSVKVHLHSEDLVGFRASDVSVLKALHDSLKNEARTCVVVSTDLLVLSATALPKLRAAIRRLSDRFDVAVDRSADGARSDLSSTVSLPSSGMSNSP